MKSLRTFTRRYYVKQVVACFLVSCLLFNIPAALATPSNPVQVAGDAIGGVAVGNTTTVNMGTSGAAVINWDGLNTSSSQVLEFIKAGGSFAVLNRVIAGGATQFDGKLFGNQGNIFIVNTRGLVFGPTSYIQAHSFVASAIDIRNDDFINQVGNKFIFAKNNEYLFSDQIGYVWNDGGTIDPGVYGDADSTVALIGSKVLNTGTIATGPGGLLVMAAGERVVLGQPGSDVVVEIQGVPTTNADPFRDGDVLNEGGQITADGGQIVLAAGDVFSTALATESKAVRVDSGIGRVVQNGTVDASSTTGDGGSVSLTAGDEVVLGPLTQTKANALPDGVGDVRPIGGRIFVSSPDTVTASPTAHLEARGNGFYDLADNGRFDIDDDTDFRGYIQVTGSYITPPVDVDLSAWSGDSEQAGLLTVGPYQGDMIIANGAQTGAPAENTIYEEWIEQQSDLGVNVDLLSPGNITVQTLSVDTDTGLEGGSGDMSFRTMFDSGSITFDTDDDISTDEGGNIFMVAGSGGITVGNILTDTASSDKATDSGQIFLLTTRPDDATDGGDITTGSMEVSGGGTSEISAIAAGTLTVNGDVTSIRNQVPQDVKKVGKALICLIADEDIFVDADLIKVEAHGKFETNADICISAGWDVDIAPTGSADITAKAKTSGSGPYTADARVVIHAGWNKDTKGAISINGINYDDRLKPLADNSGLPITVTASVAGIGGGGPPVVTPSDDWDEDDPWPQDADDGTHKFWKDERTKPYPDEETARATVTLEIDNTEYLKPSHPDSPCYDCPRPPFLPPIPAKVIVLDDDYTIARDAEDFRLYVLNNDDGGNQLVGGVIVVYTTPSGGGELKLYYDGGKLIGFEYTPPADADFIWDGDLTHPAVFTDTFTYKAKDAEGNVSINTATVTITVTNFLPVLAGDSDTIHMSTTANPTQADFPLGGLIIDSDGSYQDLIIGTDDTGTRGTVDLTDTTAAYHPLDGYVTAPGSPDTFQYTVADDHIFDTQGNPVVLSAPIDVTVENQLPSGDSWLGTTPMDTAVVDSPLAFDGFTDPDIQDTVQIVVDTYSGTDYLSGPLGTYGGDLDYDGDWTYTPDTDLPGYVGDDVDNFLAGGYDVGANPDEKFTVQLWDGQKDYTFAPDGSIISAEPVYVTGTVSVDLTNELPSGDSWLGTTAMDTAIVDGVLVVDGFGGAEAKVDTYSGTNYLSGPFGTYGGELVYDGDWTYTPDTKLPGYVGDDVDNFLAGGYDVGVNPDEKFNVKLWDGQTTYVFNKETGQIVSQTEVYGEGTVSVDLTNELPGGDSWLGTVHMDTQKADAGLVVDGFGGADVTIKTYSGAGYSGTGVFGGTLEYDGTDYTYTPDTADLPGYVGDNVDDFAAGGYDRAVNPDEKFNVELWDGQTTYEFSKETGEIINQTKVFGEGTVSVDLTNTLPSASGNLGETPPDTVLVKPQVDLTSPVVVTDVDNDSLVIVEDTYIGTAGGKLKYDAGGSEWIYTPKDGYVGPEEFNVKVSDGQTAYAFNPDGTISSSSATYGDGTVTVTVGELPAVVAAPLPRFDVPQISGCPALMNWLAGELGVGAEQIQVYFANVMAWSKAVHPCNACARLRDASTTLTDPDGAYLAALAQVVNEYVTPAAPIADEQMALIAAAMAERVDDPLAPQYAFADRWLDALAAYIGILNTELGLSDEETLALVEKYLGPVNESGNEALVAYVQAQLAAYTGM